MADVNEDEAAAAVPDEDQDYGIHSVGVDKDCEGVRTEVDETNDQQYVLVQNEMNGDHLAKNSEKQNEMEENLQNLEQLATLEREIEHQKIENEALKYECDKLTEQLSKSSDDASKANQLERETLQKEHELQLEQLEVKLRSLQQTFDELEKEKEMLEREKVQLQEQLKTKNQEREHAVNELTNANAELSEQLSLKSSLSGEYEQKIEQLLLQSKQLQSQVLSLQSEKNQILSQRDELQSVLEDLRLRYAVATEELSQSNEATHVATDAISKTTAELDHARRIVEIQSAENQELTRQLEIKADIIRKLEATNSEHSRKLENVNSKMNGSAEDHGNMNGSSDALDKYSNDLMEHLRQNAPLIERLQMEMDSAQNAINALTNLNTELKNQLKSRVSDGSTGAESVSESDGEKQILETKLNELLRENQLFQKKLEFVEEDLARQVPATVNGDVVTKAHFEALQSVMKRLETKYTQVMCDKAELMDKTERLEHIIMQLQDESNTIGEYVSLYHHQRFLLRQKTAEKDGYIYQLAHERTALQSQLTQLQLLITQLLNERGPTNSSHSGDHVTAAHSSVVEPVNEIEKQKETDCSEVHELQFKGHDPPPIHPSNIPPEKDTAQKIMHLLNKIGTSKLVDGRLYDERNYIHCGHCSGQMLVA